MNTNLHKIARRLTWVAVTVICIVVLIGMTFGPQIVAKVATHNMARKEPRLALIPEPLNDSRVNWADGTTMSRYDYEFQTPWKDVDTFDEGERITRVIYKSGIVVVFSNPKYGISRLEALREGAASKGGRPEALFGTEATRSNFALLNATLSTTPNSISVFGRKSDAIGSMVLLRLKNLELLGPPDRILLVKSDRLKGFQKCFTTRNGFSLNLFDEQDHELEFWILRDKTSTAEITQADVNRIVQTLRPAS